MVTQPSQWHRLGQVNVLQREPHRLMMAARCELGVCTLLHSLRQPVPYLTLKVSQTIACVSISNCSYASNQCPSVKDGAPHEDHDHRRGI